MKAQLTIGVCVCAIACICEGISRTWEYRTSTDVAVRAASRIIV